MEPSTRTSEKTPAATNPFFLLSRKPYFIELFIKSVAEITKFYSSVHRAITYSHDWTPDEIGDNRTPLKRTTRTFWNFNSPKISRREFEALVGDFESFRMYAIQVLRKNPAEIHPPDLNDPEALNELFVELVNSLEKDWLFHRSYNKLFHNVAKKSTMLYLDLAAYCATRHFRFLTRQAFHYLEGNFVTSLQKEGKVYIPHLQFFNESVELLYSSTEGTKVEQVIADYFIKENIQSIAELLERFDDIKLLKIDMAKGEKEFFFLNPSEYVNRDVYLAMFRNWLSEMNGLAIDFTDRESIIKNIQIDKLQIPDGLFRIDRLVDEDEFNFESDLKIFLEDQRAARRWLVRVLFNNLLQYSINRHRFEEKQGLSGVAERSEYEKIFRSYKNMSFLEQDLGCLLVECGEMSFFILLWRYLEDSSVLDTPDRLLYWGLIEKKGEGYEFSPRAKRMAKWGMKMMELAYANGQNRISYQNKSRINRSYENLKEPGNLFHWMTQLNHLDSISKALGEIIFPVRQNYTLPEITGYFKALTHAIYDVQTGAVQNSIRESIQNSRFQKSINEFNRSNETTNRSAIAFPISTIPTEVEKKVRTFSIFIGSFNLPDLLDVDDEIEYVNNRRTITDMLNYAKIFYTLVGKPAAEAASETVMQNYAQRHLELTLGRYQHKVKNEGVSVVTRMKKIWNKIESQEQYAAIKSDILGLKREIELFSGTIHILNIATNGFQGKYLERLPYSIIDVVAEAYCNAFQQFYTVGRNEEIDKLLRPSDEHYLIPITTWKINYKDTKTSVQFQKSLVYRPEIEDTAFYTLPGDYVLTDKYFDAHYINPDATLRLKFRDVLPQKIIMQSPFFEIFSNALNYMAKDPENYQLTIEITKQIDANGEELAVEVTNPLRPNFKSNKETYSKLSESAGLVANRLFFESIGGSSKFSFDEKRHIAISRITLDLIALKKSVKKGE